MESKESFDSKESKIYSLSLKGFELWTKNGVQNLQPAPEKFCFMSKESDIKRRVSGSIDAKTWHKKEAVESVVSGHHCGGQKADLPQVARPEPRESFVMLT